MWGKKQKKFFLANLSSKIIFFVFRNFFFKLDEYFYNLYDRTGNIQNFHLTVKKKLNKYERASEKKEKLGPIGRWLHLQGSEKPIFKLIKMLSRVH